MPNYYLSASDALAFLLVHDPTDARAFGFDLPFDDSESVPEDDRLKDLKGTSLTVKTTSEDPLKQDITVKVSGIERQFKFSGKFDYHKGDYRLKDVTDKKGTLYIRGTKPHGENGFNAQQYPQYKKGVTDIGDTLNSPASQWRVVDGRVVIDFWDKKRITAVFKTDDDNYVSGGSGKWVKF